MILNKTILVICLFSFYSLAFSCDKDSKRVLYIGTNAQIRHSEFDRKFGSNTVRRSHHQGNVYLGFKLSENWAIEVGKESIFSKPKNSILVEGEILNGVPIPKDLSPSEFLTNLKINSYNLDFVFYKKLFENLPLSFIPSLGISHLTMEVSRDNLFCGNFKGKIPSRKMNKSFLAFKPSMGMQYDFINGFSIRTSVSFINTYGIRLESKDITSIKLQNKPKVKLKDSFVFGVGFLINL